MGQPATVDIVHSVIYGNSAYDGNNFFAQFGKVSLTNTSVHGGCNINRGFHMQINTSPPDWKSRFAVRGCNMDCGYYEGPWGSACFSDTNTSGIEPVRSYGGHFNKCPPAPPAANECNPGYCNVCSACCQDYILDGAPCDSCVAQRCSPSTTLASVSISAAPT